tara:strand:- start:84 stop:437 length:354 start_codon:yes stop_codon:yes gene_type:complete
MKLTTLEKKKYRIRNKLKKVSSVERYRLTVSRSSKNISAQIIDDAKNVTLVSATSNKKEIKNQAKSKSDLSTLVAEILTSKAKDKNITKVYFDRGIYKYHGRVRIFVEALRKNGMEF